MNKVLKSMKKFLVVFFLVSVFSSPVFGFGHECHDIITVLAERHLNPSAKKTIGKYLGGHSIMYYSTWMDDWRHTPEYKFTNTWHAYAVDEDLKYFPRKQGDAVQAINKAVEVLKDYKNQTDSTVLVNLKYIIHCVADMHCPSHIAFKGRKYNYWVKFHAGTYTSPVDIKIHSVWDYMAFLSCRKWSAAEYVDELDLLSKKEIKKIVAGTPEDWANDNVNRCKVQFELSKPGDTLNQDFVNAAMPLIEIQMQYAGYRLAEVLNRLF